MLDTKVRYYHFFFVNKDCIHFYILLFNSLIFEFKELIPILKLSSFPSIRTSKYIVTIAGKPKLATNCIKSSSNDIFLQIIF